MIVDLLATAADTPPPDSMVSGNWIIAVIGALASAGALILGKIQGRKEASETILRSPVPTVPTQKVSSPPTWPDHRALADRVMRTEADILRIEGEMKEMRATQSAQFHAIMNAGQDREQRISDKIDGMVRSFHERIDDFVHICQSCHAGQMPPKPAPKRR